MDIMTETTISVSKEFHDWLKSKGMKGESYEDVIKKMLKPEHLQELGSSDHTPEDSDSNSEDLV